MINTWNYSMSGIPAEFGEKSQDGDHNGAMNAVLHVKNKQSSDHTTSMIFLTNPADSIRFCSRWNSGRGESKEGFQYILESRTDAQTSNKSEGWERLGSQQRPL